MGILIGFDTWGSEVFDDDSPSLRSVKYAQLSGSIIDELSVRENTDIGTTNVKDTWNKDTKILAKFVNNLEAGNIGNEGIKIVKFKIVRREVNQIQNDDIYLDEIAYQAGTNADLEFIDTTQPNKQLIYTIIPVGENGIDGTPREVQTDGDLFFGWFVVDKDTNEVLAFDKAFDSLENVTTQLNQNRTLIETFSKYPRVWYGDNNYESFSLSALFIADEWKRSGQMYQDILNKFILNPKPVIVKGDNGRIMVCDMYNPKTSTPNGTSKDKDYMQLTVDFVEVDDYYSFMNGE